MRRFLLGSKLVYRVSEPSTFVFNVAVAGNAHQQIHSESIRFTPDLPVDTHSADPARSRYQRVQVPVSNCFAMEYQADVELRPYFAPDTDIGEVSPARLPLDIMPYLLPSRYCESDRLTRLAQMQFGNLVPGYSRVQAICNWIHTNVYYLSGSTSSITSAFNTVTERAGVCRDFAHLGIAFCRALDIPARFVTGYVTGLNPPDFHAVFEAYLAGRWYLFDATRLVSLQEFIRVGTGYDAADVAFATIYGVMEMSHMELFIAETSRDEPAADGRPVSTVAE